MDEWYGVWTGLLFPVNLDTLRASNQASVNPFINRLSGD